MLTEEEIRRIARTRGLSVGLAEKDYVIDWLLKEIYASNIGQALIFKGGTAIKKAYFQETWRFSHDLDFTALNIKFEDAKNGLEEVFRNVEAESGIRLNFGSFHRTPGSITANVQFLGPLNSKNRIRLDITFDEKIIAEPVQKTINSQYPDIVSYKVNAYSLDEILSEKIRSIIQRGKSRDYYDVWLLLKTESFNRERIRKLLVEKCKLKGIDYAPEDVFDKDRLSTAKRFWESGLKDLVKTLPEFDFVIEELKGLLKNI